MTDTPADDMLNSDNLLSHLAKHEVSLHTTETLDSMRSQLSGVKSFGLNPINSPISIKLYRDPNHLVLFEIKNVNTDRGDRVIRLVVDPEENTNVSIMQSLLIELQNCVKDTLPSLENIARINTEFSDIISSEDGFKDAWFEGKIEKDFYPILGFAPDVSPIKFHQWSVGILTTASYIKDMIKIFPMEYIDGNEENNERIKMLTKMNLQIVSNIQNITTYVGLILKLNAAKVAVNGQHNRAHLIFVKSTLELIHSIHKVFDFYGVRQTVES